MFVEDRAAAEAYDQLVRVGSPERLLGDIPPAALADEIIGLLDCPGFRSLAPAMRGAVFFRILLIYSTVWQAEARRIVPAVEQAFEDLCADAPDDIEALSSGYDALYFLYWSTENAILKQQNFGARVVAPFARAIRSRAAPRSVTSTRGVGYLAQFVSRGPGNAIADVNAVILKSLAAQSREQPVILYAWMFHDPDTLAEFAKLGIQVRPITGQSSAERVEELEAAIRADSPETLISDMNSSVPAILYERRSAPIQILYQFGMPHWPLANLDGVFRVWDFDPVIAGYDPQTCVKLNIPIDLTYFRMPADAVLLAREKARLPPGRLIGTYGRLSKITPDLIAIVADVLRSHPDVTAVFGGIGDAALLKSAIEASAIPERFVIVQDFVDGHLWGHLLSIFLDTFPIPGGASCLEVAAKGKPIVSMFSSDAPNLAREQRVQMLVAHNLTAYGGILSRLLADPAFYAEASAATRRLDVEYPLPESYGPQLSSALNHVRRIKGRSAVIHV